jgi:hypothetical protein
MCLGLYMPLGATFVYCSHFSATLHELEPENPTKRTLKL